MKKAATDALAASVQSANVSACSCIQSVQDENTTAQAGGKGLRTISAATSERGKEIRSAVSH